jgi:hypothetical protein
MLLDPEPITSKATVARFDNWAFKIFCLSTLFIVIFSIRAVHSWSPLVKHSSILLACILPTVMVILGRVPIWHKTWPFPKEVLWVLLISAFGLIGPFFSENPWPTLKSTVLFMASGPFVFITARYLLEPAKNQQVFLWMVSLGALGLGFFGIYEHNYSWSPHYSREIRLFTENQLPAGALLVLLSAGPMILLNRERSTVLKILLTLCLAFPVVLIVLIGKKGPVLSMAVILFLVVFINRRYLKIILGVVFVTGCLMFFSDFTFSKYKSLIGIKESVTLRTENYFFGLHIFKQHPIWGVGFKADLAQHLDDYKLKLDDKLSKERYQKFIIRHKTFENIVVAFLVELGGLFSITYFGGLLYIVIVSSKKLLSKTQESIAGLLLVSVIAGFAVISFTFDTLRFPNLNWVFHTLLGLLVNLSQQAYLKNSFSKDGTG